MRKKQTGFSVIEILVAISVIVVLATVGIFVLHRSQDQSLSAEQIARKFDCNRRTDDIRQTDVFCGNPKFYNNPDGVTYEDYYKYYACDERLKGQPPAESAKVNDPGYYNAYYNCKDRTKLEKLRQDFIKELKKLKTKNS